MLKETWREWGAISFITKGGRFRNMGKLVNTTQAKHVFPFTHRNRRLRHTHTHMHAFRLSKSPWVIFTLDCNPSPALPWLHFIQSALTHTLLSPMMLLFSITSIASAAVWLLFRKIEKIYISPSVTGVYLSLLRTGVWSFKSIVLLIKLYLEAWWCPFERNMDMKWGRPAVNKLVKCCVVFVWPCED